MIIHKSFPGGNIQVNRIQGNDVFLVQELGDTEGWWFYWAFVSRVRREGQLRFTSKIKRSLVIGGLA